MERSQVKKLFGELDKYMDIIPYVGDGTKTRKEISDYLKSIKVPTQTISRYLGDITSGNSILLPCSDGDNVTFNKEAYYEILEVVKSCVKQEPTSKAAEVANAMSNLKTTSEEKQAQITSLKKEKEELSSIIEDYEKRVAELIAKMQVLEDEKSAIEIATFEKPILIISSEEILPLASDWEKQFVLKATDEQKPVEKVEEKQGVKEEVKQPRNGVEAFILNKANYLRKGIQRVFTDSFIAQRIKQLLEREGKEEFVPEKPYVANLLAEGHYTNQQKLALYAAFSEYRHTDFEKLLNFAGDNNINADLLIQWVESLNAEEDFLQIKNALRQFAKPTEYQMKYELARELLLGHWQVEFLYKGVPSRFRLVSEDDIEKVKQMLGLSDDAFTYHDYVTYEMEAKVQKEKKAKEAAMVKKKEMDTVQIKAPNFIKRFIIKETDIEDYGLDEEAVDYKDVEEEDEK